MPIIGLKKLKQQKRVLILKVKNMIDLYFCQLIKETTLLIIVSFDDTINI